MVDLESLVLNVSLSNFFFWSSVKFILLGCFIRSRKKAICPLVTFLKETSFLCWHNYNKVFTFLFYL